MNGILNSRNLSWFSFKLQTAWLINSVVVFLLLYVYTKNLRQINWFKCFEYDKQAGHHSDWTVFLRQTVQDYSFSKNYSIKTIKTAPDNVKWDLFLFATIPTMKLQTEVNISQKTSRDVMALKCATNPFQYIPAVFINS